MENIILLIDDDADEHEIFINALREAGVQFQCTWANGAEEGLKQLQVMQPNLIVLDYNMPKINGLELLAMLKDSAVFAQIPVVMYSTTMDSELSARAMRCGAMGCIRKPYDMQDLPVLLKPFLQNTFF